MVLCDTFAEIFADVNQCKHAPVVLACVCKSSTIATSHGAVRHKAEHFISNTVEKEKNRTKIVRQESTISPYRCKSQGSLHVKFTLGLWVIPSSHLSHLLNHQLYWNSGQRREKKSCQTQKYEAAAATHSVWFGLSPCFECPWGNFICEIEAFAFSPVYSWSDW